MDGRVEVEGSKKTGGGRNDFCRGQIQAHQPVLPDWPALYLPFYRCMSVIKNKMSSRRLPWWGEVGGERCAPRFRLIAPFCLTPSTLAATCASSSRRGKLRRNAFRSQGSRPKQRGQGCPHSTSEYLIDTDYHLIIRMLQRRGRPGCWQSSAGTWSSTNTRLCLQAAW